MKLYKKTHDLSKLFYSKSKSFEVCFYEEKRNVVLYMCVLFLTKLCTTTPLEPAQKKQRIRRWKTN